MKESLGQYLRRKREAHLISIQEISHSTGISIPMISALEEDKFHLIPDSTVITRYLKKYAAHVGLDKKDILNRYKKQWNYNNQKEYIFPHLSTPPEGGKPSGPMRAVGRFSRKQIIEGIFWAGIVVWAFVLIYLYIHVMSLRKTGIPVNQGMISSTETWQDASYQINEPVPSHTSEGKTNAPGHSLQGPLRSTDTIPLENNTVKKELSSQNPGVRRVPGKAKIIGNLKSKRYHMPGMKYYQSVRPQNRVIFDSEAEALKEGYRKAPE